MDNYAASNKKRWNQAADYNYSTWNIQDFLDDPGRLSKIVQADRHYVGDVTGKSLVHLQCHFGMDTLSWARLGAECTGIDNSDRGIQLARDLNQRAGLTATFIEADVYGASEAVAAQQFDIVYTSGGVLCWLPKVAPWASTVARLLKPGGVFYMREAHPVLWSLDVERTDRQLTVTRPYFETPEPKRWDEGPSWEELPGLEPMTEYVWSHGLGEIITSLIDSGLTISLLEEHQTLLWQALHFMKQDAEGWWELPEGETRLPLMYSILARKE